MGYGFLLGDGGLDLGRWGVGSLSVGSGAGNLRGVGLNENVYGLFLSRVNEKIHRKLYLDSIGYIRVSFSLGLIFQLFEIEKFQPFRKTNRLDLT